MANQTWIRVYLENTLLVNLFISQTSEACGFGLRVPSKRNGTHANFVVRPVSRA